MSNQQGGGRPRSSKSRSRSTPSGSTFLGSRGNSKACKKSSSDSPSRSSPTDIAKWEGDVHSVLSHPLVLPFLCSLHGKDPGTLEYLSKKSNFYDDKSESKKNFDDILGTVVTNWMKDNPNRTEDQLTKLLARKIEEKHSETKFHSDDQVRLHNPNTNEVDGKIDIIFTPDGKNSKTEEPSSTPFAMLAVGCDCCDWCEKMDQHLKYLKSMGEGGQSDSRLGFLKPIILAILTIEGEDENDYSNLKTKLGVAFCSPKSADGGEYRTSLLWHSYKEGKLASASEDFGNLLQAISDFSRWREESEPSNWEYLGPDCCKVVVDQNGEKESKVLRSYDTRFRPTHRRSVIYEEYLGCKPFFEIPSAAVTDAASDSRQRRPEGELKVIATPYREGRHYATNPAEFVPIICELEKLHKAGFVHGDIRAFNTVFADEETGWLIDFDFGGKADQESTTYPPGYKTYLTDGRHRGKEGMKIEKLHDWRSLGALIFLVHHFCPSEEADANLLFPVRYSWLDLREQPTDKMINDLKNFCVELNDAKGWRLKLDFDFERVL